MKKETLEEFGKMTGKDIIPFLSETVRFFKTDYVSLVSFYSGQIGQIQKGVFDNLYKLRLECDQVLAVFSQQASRMKHLKWFDILEIVEDIDSRLRTAERINKWSRSSLKGVGYSPLLQFDYIQLPLQTIERIGSDILGSSDPEKWYEISKDNWLEEEEYTIEGGTLLKLNTPIQGQNLIVNSVVAVMSGKSLYGRDLAANLEISEDEEDIVSLDYDPTIQQAVKILANLKQNDNPAYPADGLQREIVIGGTRALMNFPAITRQMTSTFATDDTLKNFKVLNINVDQDNLNIDFQVYTRLDEALQEKSVV